MSLFSKILLFLALLIQSWYVAGFVATASQQKQRDTLVLFDAAAASSSSTTTPSDETKQRLLDLLASVPRNAATSSRQTREILATVRALEHHCPTLPEAVLPNSAGKWELVWTAQDKDTNDDSGTPLSPFRWINPLENQAYSNNPAGRANPILPLEVQDFLTQRGILSAQPQDAFAKDAGRTSTQTIDVKNRRVINVVSVPLAGASPPAALTVTVDFTPTAADPRRVNVKFQSFVVAWGDVKLEFPLGIIGPTGWLRTTYLDDTLRVTRGHKGSVFVLTRRAKKRAGTTMD